MNIAIASLASGSSGNCYLVKSEKVNILVDAGISARQITERLKLYGVNDIPDRLLVTHEHSDHIKGIPVLLKKGIRIMGTERTICSIPDEKLIAASEYIKRGDKFNIGDIEVSCFHVSHDAADPVGYSFSCNGKCISIITDTGYVTDECYGYMQKSDILVLESNHDVSMLRIGKYPYFLKQRILSKEGHLSNEAAAEAISKILRVDEVTGKKKDRMILLAHLSQQNNFPQMAIATINNILENDGFNPGKDVRIRTLSRTEASDLFVL